MWQSIALVERWQLLDMGNGAEITQLVTITSSGLSSQYGSGRLDSSLLYEREGQQLSAAGKAREVYLCEL